MSVGIILLRKYKIQKSQNQKKKQTNVTKLYDNDFICMPFIIFFYA